MTYIYPLRHYLGYTPASQPNLIFDLDARHVTTDPLGEVTVSEMTDLSGNGNVAVQTIKERQPVYLTNQLNGLPAIHADTSLKYMSFFTAGALASLRNKSQATLIVVAKWTGSASNVPIFTMTETSATSGRLVMQRTGSAERAVVRNTAGAVTPTGGTPDTSNYKRLAITVNFDTSVVKGYQNNVEVYTATPSAGNFTDTDAGIMRLLTNGDNTVNSGGYLFRCILYDRELTADELLYHERGLAALMGE